MFLRKTGLVMFPRTHEDISNEPALIARSLSRLASPSKDSCMIRAFDKLIQMDETVSKGLYQDFFLIPFDCWFGLC